MTGECGIQGCGKAAVTSVAVRCSVWFISQSHYDNERDIWDIGGQISPQFLHGMMHVCEAHGLKEKTNGQVTGGDSVHL